MRPDDNRLAAADPALPGLATVLDPAALLARLGGPWGSGGSAEVTYLRYKPGTSLVAGLRITDDGGRSRQAFAVAYRPVAVEKIAKVVRAGERDDVGRGTAVDRAAGLALGEATADRHLPGVRAVLAGAGALVPLVYKPGRRWVAVADGDGGRVLVKVHRPAAAAAHVAAHRLLAGAGLPTADLGRVSGRGVVRTAFVPGTPLDLLGEAGLWGTVGGILAALHAAPVPPGAPAGSAPADPTAALASAVVAVRAIVPAAGERARCAAAAARQVLTGRAAVALVHGDLSADQVIVRPDLLIVRPDLLDGGPAGPGAGSVTGVRPTDAEVVGAAGGAARAGAGQAPLTLVDLDRGGVADPLTDLASWSAAEVVAGRAPAAADPAEVLGPLLDGYRAAGGRVDHRALAARTAAALLQRATEPFRRHERGWSDRVSELVGAAHRLAVTAAARPTAGGPRPARLGGARGAGPAAGVTRGAGPGPGVAGGAEPAPPAAPAPAAPGEPAAAVPVDRAATAPIDHVAPAPGRLPDEIVDGEHRYTLVRTWPRGSDHALVELAPAGADADAGVDARPPVAGQWFADPAALDRAAAAAPTPARPLGRVLLQPAGADARLPALAAVLALPGARLVAHRPGRRAVVRVTGPGTGTGPGTEFVKVVRPSRGPAMARRAGYVRAVLGDAVPELLDHRGAARGVLRWSDVGGSTLLAVGADPARPLAELRAGWAAAGHLVTALHAADPDPDLARHDVEEELTAVTAWLGPAVHHGLLDPGRVATARDAVAAALRAVPDRPLLGVLHRDLHDKQLLLRPDGTVGMIDVDTLAVGERALDVANLLVHLDLRRRQGLLSPARAAAARAALRAVLPADPRLWDRVPAYAAATRLRLAGVYAFRPRWRRLAHDLLGLVAAPAGGAPPR